MPTTDDLKLQRDGHLSAGRFHPKWQTAPTEILPVVGYGYDEAGERVSVLRATAHGHIEYGTRCREAVRYEWIEGEEGVHDG